MVPSLVNERNEDLMTTSPVADLNRPAPSPIVFPQVADGGGYSTEFVLIGATEGATAILHPYSADGTSW